MKKQVTQSGIYLVLADKPEHMGFLHSALHQGQSATHVYGKA